MQDHVAIKRRSLLQPTVKAGCKARITVKKLLRFSEYRVCLVVYAKLQNWLQLYGSALAIIFTNFCSIA